MTFSTNSGVLAAPVANNGTFTIGYAPGRTGGDFSGGFQHQLSILQKVYSSPNDFTVAFGGTLATITWKGANTLPAGAPYRVQFDIAGESPAEFPEITRASRAYLERVDFGMPATTSTVSLRVAAAVAAAGPIALIPAGQTFDVPRNINISSSGVDTARVFTVTGRDEYGVTMSETITGVNAATVQGNKAFKTITSISVDAACAGNISAGFGNKLGFPIFLPSVGAVALELQDGVVAGAGTKVPGSAYSTPATVNGADVRGTYVPAVAPDGTKAYSAYIYVSTRNAKGVAQV